MGCVWYFIVKDAETWVPNMNFILFGTPAIQDVYMLGWEHAYNVCLYIGYYLFVVGEVCPRNTTELGVTIVIHITSAVLNGIIIGNMAMYMIEINKSHSNFQESLDVVNGAMNSLSIHGEVKR
jgi:hypothetical protein